MTHAGLWVPLAAVLTTAGCASIGPVSVPRDRLDYTTAVAESWKEQTLLNIVRLRYGDAPSFLDVSSVISSYGVQAQASAGGFVSSDRTTAVPYSSATLGANATYLDRPTITYTPLGGAKFTRSLLTPLPPVAVFELIQAGYPADRILMLTCRALNGVYGRSTLGRQARAPDPEFLQLLAALRRIQLSGAIALRLDKRAADEVGALVIAGRRSPEVERDARLVQSILNLKPGPNGDFAIVEGAVPRNTQELAVLTRSMLDILQEVGGGIEVPASHVAEGRALAVADMTDRPLIVIHAGAAAPANAATAVRYRDTWYWIDDDDFSSKATYTFLMVFFSLAETGAVPQPPVITIPAG